MILNLGSLSFNADIDGGGGTPAWGTEMGQGDGYKFNFEDVGTLMTGLIYNSIPDINNVTCPLGKGGQQRSDYEFVIASLFKKVYVNGLKVNGAEFLLLVVKKLVGAHHVGRRTLKYNPRMIIFFLFHSICNSSNFSWMMAIVIKYLSTIIRTNIF